MRGDESRIIRAAEMHKSLTAMHSEHADLQTIIGLIRSNRPLFNDTKATVWTVSAIQNRQSLIRAKIARYEFEIASEEASKRIGVEVDYEDGEDDTQDNVVIIR